MDKQQPTIYDPKKTYDKMLPKSREYIRESLLRLFKNSIVKTTSGEIYKTYTCNRNSGKYHEHNCPWARDIKPKYQSILPKSRAEERGYQPCRQCMKKEYDDLCREIYKCDIPTVCTPSK